MRPRIVHIAIDYDNPHRGRPTRAIRDFIGRLDFAENVVFSLKRTANPFAALASAPLLPPTESRAERVSTMRYWGLPGGIGLAFSMRIVSRRILKSLRQNGIRPDLVHAHKMTFEGLSALAVAERHDVALFLSIRGEVEEKVLRFKPLYRPVYQRMLNRAAHIFFVSAWYKKRLRERLRFDDARTSRLPNWVRNETADIFPVRPDRQFVSVLNLNDWRRKGLGTLLEALALLKDQGVEVELDIIGAGTPKAEQELRQEIDKHRLGAEVTMLGRIDNAVLLKTLGRYIALVLPSKNETFGMVYAEAIFAGVPVIMNQDSGIDGYLDGIDVASYAQPNDPADLARKLESMLENGDGMRAAITTNAQLIHQRFSSDLAIDTYKTQVFKACVDVNSARHVLQIVAEPLS